MAKKKKRLTKANLRKLRQRIARKNFGLTRKKVKTITSRSTKLRIRKVAKKKRRTFRRSGLKPLAILFSAGSYGALRERMSKLLAPITSRIPIAGNLSDEIGMFVAAMLVHNNVRNKTMKDIAMAGMVVESARIGEGISQGAFQGSSNGVGSGSALFSPTLG